MNEGGTVSPYPAVGSKFAEVAALPESDESLAGRALADSAALTTLYLRYVDAIYRFFRLRTGNEMLAEDLTSQTFTQMLEALPRFRVERFRAWLFTIAHNVLIDSHRRQRFSVPLEAAGDLHANGEDPETATINSLTGAELRSALSHLTADQRAVIDCRLLGLTGTEIAAALGKSLPWVHTTQYRALQRLRALMSEDEKVNTR